MVGRHSWQDWDCRVHIRMLYVLAHILGRHQCSNIRYEYMAHEQRTNHIESRKRKTKHINQIRTNHYYCKSWAEYQRRKSRGDVLRGMDFAAQTFHKDDFQKFDFNDVDDTAILKYVPELTKKLRK